MKRNLALCVGNGMMGDDGAGVLLAQMLNEAPLPDWDALNGGSAPENILHRVRELAPERVLVVDAADMDLPPGSVRRIRDDRLDDPFLLTTHTLPLTFLIESLRAFAPRVELLGIQPETVAFGYPMSPAVKEAVGRVYANLEAGQVDWACL
ncbi:MAG: hydrogenase maturation peptidase HycI [Chloroflexota bacterium]